MSSVRYGVLVSGRGSNLGAIGRARGRIGGTLAGVVSSSAAAGALGIAEGLGVPTRVVEPVRGEGRDTYDARVIAACESLELDWIVLAGWMRILGDRMLERYAGRIVNIHPSLLPAFPGLHPHRQALEAGVCVSGCTVHLVEPGAVDGGRILGQRVVPVFAGDDEAALAARVLTEEHDLYVAVLARLFRSGATPEQVLARW